MFVTHSLVFCVHRMLVYNNIFWSSTLVLVFFTLVPLTFKNTRKQRTAKRRRIPSAHELHLMYRFRANRTEGDSNANKRLVCIRCGVHTEFAVRLPFPLVYTHLKIDWHAMYSLSHKNVTCISARKTITIKKMHIVKKYSFCTITQLVDCPVFIVVDYCLVPSGHTFDQFFSILCKKWTLDFFFVRRQTFLKGFASSDCAGQIVMLFFSFHAVHRWLRCLGSLSSWSNQLAVSSQNHFLIDKPW